jgi:murein DD-endopeptidase
VSGQPRTRPSLADATGNYVSINIGGGRFAFYEHLMPGLLVRPGQRVARGQVIGRLGSTGQASRPHLHFHLADTDSPLDAEGQPYLLEGVHVVGRYASIVDFERGAPWQRTVSQPSGPMFPTPNAVISVNTADH